MFRFHAEIVQLRSNKNDETYAMMDSGYINFSECTTQKCLN